MYIVPLKKAKEFFYKSLFLLTPSPPLVSIVLYAWLQHCTRGEGGGEKMCHFDKLQLYCISVPGVLTWVVAFLDKQQISFWTENKVFFFYHISIFLKILKSLKLVRPIESVSINSFAVILLATRSKSFYEECIWWMDKGNILFYYINSNEIQGELSRENLISSHVKIMCYLHMWKYHCCYGYIINRAFHTTGH